MIRGKAGPGGEEWRNAFLVSIGLHVGLVLLFTVTSHLWNRPRPLPPVYTVKLFDAKVAPRAKPAPSSQLESSKVPSEHSQNVSKTPAKKKTVKRPPAKKKQAQSKKSTPRKKISRNPRKTVKKKTVKPKTDAKSRAEAERLLKKRLKDIERKVNRKKAGDRLKKRLAAIETSVKKRPASSSRRSAGSVTKADAAAVPAASGRERIEAGELLRRYCREVYAKVRRHWILPEQLLARSGLECVVAVLILSDGTAQKVWFERKSGHSLFDQSAIRAVREAGPFPRLPGELRPGPLDIGIRFKPGEVGF